MARYYPLLLPYSLLLPDLPLPLCFLRAQIWELLDFGFIQPVDDCILPLLYIHSFHQFIVLKPHLSCGHVAAFFQVAPRSVNYGHIVFLVPLDAVGFRELGAVGEQVIRNGIPGLTLIGAEAEINVCAAEIIDVEPYIFWPAVCYKILISVGVS